MPRKHIAEIEAKRAAENPAPANGVVPRAFPIVGKGCITASDYTSLTVSMLRTLVRNGTIPAQRQGDRILILREDLDLYLIQSKRTKRYQPTAEK